MRDIVRAELDAIEPCDELESVHLAEAIAWVESGAELCRTAKPATPPMHLVSYFAIVHGESILLVDHKNAQLWLPSGGHVEPGEHPRTTVLRELNEELGIESTRPVGPPLMVTCTTTVGLTAGHVDVPLWYVVEASRHQGILFDASEFNAMQWFSFSNAPLHRSDPHLGRFIAKLSSSIEMRGCGKRNSTLNVRH